MKKLILSCSLMALTLPAYAAETISCDTLPTCSELGYDDLVNQCPKDYLSCPFDRSQGKCIYEAAIGQIGYFTKDPGNGWLQCNGYIYNTKKYPDLAAALADKYVISDKIFQVPDYRGDFLRVYGGNSDEANTRQAEGLPNITGAIGSNAGRAQFASQSGAFYSVSSGLSYFSNDNTETAGVTAYFDASKSNPIYGASSHVTPVNTAVYAYIYAGKVNKDGGNPNLASCSSGQYYYADGTCSSSFNSSKALKGIVSAVKSSTSATTITYVYGGTEKSNLKNAIKNCTSSGGYLASYTDWKVVPAGIPTTQSIVRSVKSGTYYYSGTENEYYCTSNSTTSCSLKSSGLLTRSISYCYATHTAVK